MDVHINKDFKILWKISDKDLENNFSNQISTVTLECVVESSQSWEKKRIEKWLINLERNKLYINKNKKSFLIYSYGAKVDGKIMIVGNRLINSSVKLK